MLNLLQPDLMELRTAFNTLEGKRFFDNEIRRLSDYSLLGAIVWINKVRIEALIAINNQLEKEPNLDWGQAYSSYLKNIGYFVIYGASGYHRYIVYPNGNIEFSSFHASPEKTNLARELGFGIQ
jgi:hypothetical protein